MRRSVFHDGERRSRISEGGMGAGRTSHKPHNAADLRIRPGMRSGVNTWKTPTGDEDQAVQSAPQGGVCGPGDEPMRCCGRVFMWKPIHPRMPPGRARPARLAARSSRRNHAAGEPSRPATPWTRSASTFSRYASERPRRLGAERRIMHHTRRHLPQLRRNGDWARRRVRFDHCERAVAP
jgi:hypothetical protein